MKALKLLILATSVLFSGLATADDVETRSMNVVIAGEAGHEAMPIHLFGGAVSGVDLHTMQVGESQSIVDESGRSIVITRQESGFRFDIDGRMIEVPEMPQFGEYATFVGNSDVTADFDVEVVGGDFAMPVHPLHEGNTVTIMSNEPLDASVQESIKSVLLSAGRDDTVKFISGGVSTEARHVTLIRKDVEAEH